MLDFRRNHLGHMLSLGHLGSERGQQYNGGEVKHHTRDHACR